MPNQFNRIHPSSRNEEVIAQINNNFAKIDNENITKTFKGDNGSNSIVQGRLPNGRYGQIYYDDDGTARILIGQHPSADRMGIWVSREGYDILEELEA